MALKFLIEDKINVFPSIQTMDLLFCQSRSFGQYTGLLGLKCCRSVTFSLCYCFGYQVLILGLDHAGKTSLLEQVKRIYSTQPPMPMSMIPPTVGLNGDKTQFIFLGGLLFLF